MYILDKWNTADNLQSDKNYTCFVFHNTQLILKQHFKRGHHLRAIFLIINKHQNESQ